MGYGWWGRKESDRTELVTHTQEAPWGSRDTCENFTDVDSLLPPFGAERPICHRDRSTEEGSLASRPPEAIPCELSGQGDSLHPAEEKLRLRETRWLVRGAPQMFITKNSEDNGEIAQLSSPLGPFLHGHFCLILF